MTGRNDVVPGPPKIQNLRLSYQYRLTSSFVSGCFMGDVVGNRAGSKVIYIYEDVIFLYFLIGQCNVA